jgi:hypothetical protein
VLWTIHDFLGYDVITRVAHQGFVACPICGLDFRGEHSIKLRKMVYTHTQRWWPNGHLYRYEGMKDNFTRQLETRMKPKVVIAQKN